MMMVRQLNSFDAAIYQSLRLRALQESPASFSSSHADEVGRTLAEIAIRVTPATDGSRCVFGVFAADELAGICAFMRPQAEKLRHRAELAGLYVAPQFRRRGFGHALVEAVIAHAGSVGGIRQLKLGVNAANTPARRLYQSAGFTRVGVEPDALFVGGKYDDEETYVLRCEQGA